MGRKCAVPHCYTGYRKCTEKAALYRVPTDDFFLTKWNESIAREDRPITPKDYVCEKHFKDDDILRKRIRKDVVEVYQRPRLKPDAIPSIFPDLPEFILKMTKKRRRINAYVPINILPKATDVESEKPEKIIIKSEPECISETNEDKTVNNDEIDIKSEPDDASSLPEYDLPSVPEDKEEFDANGAKLYHCNECTYSTKFPHNLRTHKVKHLSGDDAYMSCEFCKNYKTKWEITYINHMKSKHNIILKDIYKCPVCGFKTKNKKFLAKHFENEHPNDENIESKFKCDFTGCNFETDSKTLLGIHDLTHQNAEDTSLKSFSCKECFFSSNCKRSLANHVKSAHSDGNTKITAQKATPVKKNGCKNVSHVIKKVIPKKNFRCSRCPYKSQSEILLKKHISKHLSLEKVFECKKCSYTASSESSISEHSINTHHCNECLFTTQDKSEYIRHTLTHRNTTIEIVTKPQEEDEEAGHEYAPMMQEFCQVTIKEENPEIFIQE